MRTAPLQPTSARRPAPAASGRTARHPRRGIAQLELMMALPVLIGFTFVMIWVGMAMSAQARTAVTARHDAWAARDEGAGSGLRFTQEGSVSRTATEQVVFGSWSRSMAPAKASSTILGGAWDHQRVDLNQQPSYQTFGRLVGDTAGDAVSALDGVIGDIPDVGDMLADQVGALEGEWTPKDMDIFERMIEKAKSDAIDSIAGQIAKLGKEIARISAKIASNPINLIGLPAKLKALKTLVTELGDGIDALEELL